MHKRVVKRTVRDFVFSVLSSLLYTFARQIVILPVLAARLSEDTYGTVLTVLGLVSVLGALVGGTLNNIRLVQAQKYGDAKGKGDFLILCTAGSGLCVLAVLLLSRVFHLPALCCVLLAVYVCVDNFYQYAGAHFRLALDFERSLIQNAVVCAVCVPAALLFAGSMAVIIGRRLLSQKRMGQGMAQNMEKHMRNAFIAFIPDNLCLSARARSFPHPCTQ